MARLANFSRFNFLWCWSLVFAVSGCAPYYNDTGYYVEYTGYDDTTRNGSIRWLSERREVGRPEPAAPIKEAPRAAPRVALAKPSPSSRQPAIPPLERPLAARPLDPSSSGTSDRFSVAGLSEREVESFYGRAEERTDEGPRRTWIYKKPSCSLQVVFFLDLTRNGYYVLDQKAKGPTGYTMSVEECLRDVRSARSE